MSSNLPIRFSHNHHLLSVKGCESEPDVLAFEGDEALSTPFRYRIEFTSADHAISKEMMLMKAGSLTLQAPADQGYGIKIQQPVRVIQGGAAMHSHARRDEDFGVRFDGIPDRPYISGVLYDSAHGDHVTELSFDVSQVPQEVMQCDRKLEPKKQ